MVLIVIGFEESLHITSSTGSLIVLLSADFTQADVQDNQMYYAITFSPPQGIRYMDSVKEERAISKNFLVFDSFHYPLQML